MAWVARLDELDSLDEPANPPVPLVTPRPEGWWTGIGCNRRRCVESHISPLDARLLAYWVKPPCFACSLSLRPSDGTRPERRHPDSPATGGERQRSASGGLRFGDHGMGIDGAK